jgi:hypothetical protein
VSKGGGAKYVLRMSYHHLYPHSNPCDSASRFSMARHATKSKRHAEDCGAYVSRRSLPNPHGVVVSEWAKA